MEKREKKRNKRKKKKKKREKNKKVWNHVYFGCLVFWKWISYGF